MNETNPPATDRPVLNVNTQRIGMANSANVVASIGSRPAPVIGSSLPIFGKPPQPPPDPTAKATSKALFGSQISFMPDSPSKQTIARSPTK